MEIREIKKKGCKKRAYGGFSYYENAFIEGTRWRKRKTIAHKLAMQSKKWSNNGTGNQQMLLLMEATINEK